MGSLFAYDENIPFKQLKHITPKKITRNHQTDISKTIVAVIDFKIISFVRSIILRTVREKKQK
jgi:hypothetical protein